MSTRNLIVAGVDGSEGGRRALDWAVREAQARGGAVQAVIAWSWDGLDFGPIPATTPEQEQEQSARVLDAEIKAIVAAHGSHLPIAAEVIEGRPADVLATAGHAGDLLVLGSHGHSRIRHTVLGSVSEECIRKAVCPVVVIPIPVQPPAHTNEPAIRP